MTRILSSFLHRPAPLLAPAILPAILLVLLAAPAHAQTSLLWSFSGLENAQSIAVVPDVDGDGHPDVCFDTYDFGPNGPDHLFLVSGASSGAGTLIWSARPIGGATPGGGYGDNCLRLGADYNGDGRADLLFATAYGCRTAFTINAQSGQTIWAFDTYTQYNPTYAGWIYAMDNLGSDLTGDGVPEVVVASGSYNDRIHCLNGATGAIRWVYLAGDACTDVLSCQDINGDGVRDVVCLRGDDAIPEQVTALSGSSGAQIWTRQIGGAPWNLTFIDDVTGDGIAEIVPSSWAATLYCVNGATGAVVWSVATPGQQRVVALDDVNGDGKKDVAVGYDMTSTCRVFSGATGAQIWSTPFTDWTWAIDRLADVTGDGINDVAVGDFDGKVTVLNGVTGQVFWSWTNPTGDKIMTLRGVPDLNGNGVPDVVAGTQMLSNGAGGDVYALEGNMSPTSVSGGAAPRLLSNAAPNPFRDQVVWRLAVDRPAIARLLVYGADGRLVRDLGDRPVAAHSGPSISWDGTDGSGTRLPAGIYEARLLLDGRPAERGRVVLVR